MREFSFFRLTRLVQNRLIQDLTPLAIGAAIVVGLQLLSLLFSLIGGSELSGAFSKGDEAVLMRLAVIGCLLVSSRAFFGMQAARASTEWLLLPATTTEKYLATLVSTQVLVPVAAFLAAAVFWVATHGFVAMHLDFPWQVWGAFAVMNLVLMTGSSVFRKWAGLKTLGISVAFTLVAVVIFATSLRLLWGAGTFEPQDHQRLMHFASMGSGKVLEVLGYIVLYGLTPLAALAFGFFRVQEKEARDAVQ